MARFLSAEWFDEVAPLEVPRRPGEVVLGQVVTGGPDGEVRYRVIVGDGAARIAAGDGDGADVTFTTDHATATAMARGELSVQAALGSGRIRVGGDLTRLGALHGGVDPVPPAVRTATTWGTEP